MLDRASQSASERNWRVIKFGGTSVSSPQYWNTISAQAQQGVESGQHVLVVVSALSGITDLLGRLANEADIAGRSEILSEIDRRHQDLIAQLGLEQHAVFTQHQRDLKSLCTQVQFPCNAGNRAVLLAFGELMSSSIGVEVLCQSGLPANLLDARQWLRAAVGAAHSPLSVRCSDEGDPALEAKLATVGQLHITQGFIVSGPKGETCLLGRGGSDTSAACFAARLQAKVLEIWTDVPGMFTADPRIVPEARLLNHLGYREAQELASMGAKVLHPPSIQPARRHGIPIWIKDTRHPDFPGTRIGAGDSESLAQVKGVVSRKGIILITMEDPAMWRQAGFLADAFAVFKEHKYSVDLISTSESTVTVTLDPESAVDADGSRFIRFIDDLSGLCQVEVKTDCVSISMVGNAIRRILGKLSSALDLFQDRHVHLVTQSANDLNLTLVVDSEHADSLVRKLHQTLISSQADNRAEFGPSWSEMNRTTSSGCISPEWWRARAPELLKILGRRECAYVYDLDIICKAAQRLLALHTVHRVLYSVKANDHPRILQLMAQQGLGFECVSIAEVEHVLETVPGVQPAEILFTPNFAPREEYEKAFQAGVRVTVDNSWVLREWHELFAHKELFLRLDLESGHGHHRKVITSGKESKFGISLDHLGELSDHLKKHDIRVTGLHAHTGSGVTDVSVWQEQLLRLLAVLPRFPAVKVLDLGGGLGVPDRPEQSRLDLAELDELLHATLGETEIQLWLEPGRYLVANGGVLLARVTQLKDKGNYHYVGIATGMNSLIRPALYGSYHDIVNLSRLDLPSTVHCRIVGPICESGDVLGESRLLPPTCEGDVLLIANTGAYGRVMASHYNRRIPAEELFLAS